MTASLLLICGIILSFAFSAIFSGVETGMYQLSRLRLRLKKERKEFFFVTLAKTLSDTPALLLTILLGNNLANYFATSLTTYLLFRIIRSGRSVEFYTTVLITPILFIFCELLPKNIFFYRADLLMPYFSPLLLILNKLFRWSGIVPMLKLFSKASEKLLGWHKSSKALLTAAHQPHINAIFHESHEEGLLSTVQADIIKRMSGLTQLTVKSVLTPSHKVRTVNINTGKAELLDILAKSPYTRLPVTDARNAEILGFINIYGPLLSQADFDSLKSFIKPIEKVPSNTTVSDAISIMQDQKLKIMLVTRPVFGTKSRPLGIITMKDLVEELIGELSEW